MALAVLGAALLLAALLGRRAAGGDLQHFGRTLQRMLRKRGRLGPGGWLDGARVGEPELGPVRDGIARYREARFGRRPLAPGEARRLARQARQALGGLPPSFLREAPRPPSRA